ncbi:unnamed protein product, partial [Staurois parvus]
MSCQSAPASMICLLLPVSAHQCRLSVPIIVAYQC